LNKILLALLLALLLLFASGAFAADDPINVVYLDTASEKVGVENDAENNLHFIIDKTLTPPARVKFGIVADFVAGTSLTKNDILVTYAGNTYKVVFVRAFEDNSYTAFHVINPNSSSARIGNEIVFSKGERKTIQFEGIHLNLIWPSETEKFDFFVEFAFTDTEFKSKAKERYTELSNQIRDNFEENANTAGFGWMNLNETTRLNQDYIAFLKRTGFVPLKHGVFESASTSGGSRLSTFTKKYGAAENPNIIVEFSFFEDLKNNYSVSRFFVLFRKDLADGKGIKTKKTLKYKKVDGSDGEYVLDVFPLNGKYYALLASINEKPIAKPSSSKNNFYILTVNLKNEADLWNAIKQISEIEELTSFEKYVLRDKQQQDKLKSTGFTEYSGIDLEIKQLEEVSERETINAEQKKSALQTLNDLKQIYERFSTYNKSIPSFVSININYHVQEGLAPIPAEMMLRFYNPTNLEEETGLTLNQLKNCYPDNPYGRTFIYAADSEKLFGYLKDMKEITDKLSDISDTFSINVSQESDLFNSIIDNLEDDDLSLKLKMITELKKCSKISDKDYVVLYYLPPLDQLPGDISLVDWSNSLSFYSELTGDTFKAEKRINVAPDDSSEEFKDKELLYIKKDSIKASIGREANIRIESNLVINGKKYYQEIYLNGLWEEDEFAK